MALYVDSSAILKLLLREPESGALVHALQAYGRDLLTSEVSEVEVGRAAARYGVGPERAEAALARFTLVRLDDATRHAAVRVEPSELRSLDAIHLASALNVRDAVTGFVCYDVGLAKAAVEAGFRVLAPSRPPAGPSAHA